MSSCLSGGGRAYALNLDVIKSSSTFTTSNSSSPSSTLSESTNSIFTRKPRTPRKRPNQTYNEAAALLSTAYPKLFPPKNHPKPFKLTKSHDNRGPFLSEPSDLIIPFHHHSRGSGGGKGYLPQLGSSCSSFPAEARVEKPCLSPGEVTSRGDLLEICDEFEEDFDAESILDEEVEEGIDSIMGNLRVEEEEINNRDSTPTSSYCYGFPVGMGFEFGCGMRNELRAMRNVDDTDWWSSTTVNVVDITRRIATIPIEKKKKKKATTRKMKTETETKANSASDERKEGSLSTAATSEESFPHPAAGFRLKLNYDNVLNAWSDKGSPFSGEAPAAESAGNDVQARLAQIELFPENGAVRGAIVLRYKEKRRTRLFSKKIRYQVRKANADQRPRIKGRFVRTPSSGDDD